MSETQYCTPLLVSEGNVSVLERIPISDGSYNEAYIQDLAFAHPSCLPISELDRSYEGLIPVCKELNTPAGPLDILYVTPQGRLVIVEAKLWRNPEARRKVIGQILDYAKELSRWDYQDLQREISRATGRKGNVLYDLVKDQHPQITEAEFVDDVTRTLAKGRYLLLILGDGIREGVAAITEFLEEAGQLEFTFGMVELALYKTPSGRTLVQPRVLAKTVIFKRLVISTEMDNLLITEERDADKTTAISSSEPTDLQQFYLEFWPEWLSELKLDDPSQPLPKTAATTTGNVFFPMPPSGGQSWMTVYFYQQANEVGVFLTFTRGEFANLAYKDLLSQRGAIDEELGIQIDWQSDGEKHKLLFKRQFPDVRALENRVAIKEFFSETVNRFVNVFRPRLQRLVDNE